MARLVSTSEVKASVLNGTSKTPAPGVMMTIDVPVLTRSRPMCSNARYDDATCIASKMLPRRAEVGRPAILGGHDSVNLGISSAAIEVSGK